MSNTAKIDATILAIDYGEKRIGLAIKKSGHSTVATLNYLPNQERALDDLQKIVDDFKIERIVLGLPRGLDGQKTNQTDAVEAFGERLAKVVGVDIVYQDETLSSEEAVRRLPKGLTAKQQRERIDSEAAKVILEDYLL